MVFSLQRGQRQEVNLSLIVSNREFMLPSTVAIAAFRKCQDRLTVDLVIQSSLMKLMVSMSSKQFADEVLKGHNDYRKKHGVPPLKLCKKLNREAQQYSEALASTRILKHSSESSSGRFGENLAWASYDQSGTEVADRWYSEIKNYNFQSPGFSSNTGHILQQMKVWKRTQRRWKAGKAGSNGLMA
ncbi:Golgi-associated plant pathogenesis-related protein 1-like [Sphaerodactylus townsendi]|uniref:Golgi-associated plant pathogenesis-related protein 1-like n=1 Tax=Sphaerodactylus townsendi TaxID=933632 RepID=UPI0020266294|nr:Golgi-associated plant pathogenesis-related protein 1-like [Sphaerodactylus townsendi]